MSYYQTMDKSLYSITKYLKSRAVFELPIINCTYNVNISGTYNNLFARSTALDNYFHFNLKKICI